jgi:hypothetical protein
MGSKSCQSLATASQTIVSGANWSKVRPHNSKCARILRRGRISNKFCYLKFFLSIHWKTRLFTDLESEIVEKNREKMLFLGRSRVFSQWPNFLAGLADFLDRRLQHCGTVYTLNLPAHLVVVATSEVVQILPREFQRFNIVKIEKNAD